MTTPPPLVWTENDILGKKISLHREIKKTRWCEKNSLVKKTYPHKNSHMSKNKTYTEKTYTN